MVRMTILRGMKPGDTLAIVSRSDQMKVVAQMNCRGYGTFRQRKVILVDGRAGTAKDAILVTCIEAMPPKKKRGRPKKPPGQSENAIS